MSGTVHEIRNSDAAAAFLQQGIWLQRVKPVTEATVRTLLDWAAELISAGEPLPPLGVLADIGHIAFDPAHVVTHSHPEIPGWSQLARTYEDYVLGKIYADASFERGADALSRYQGRDRARGLAFVMTQWRQRAGFGGVLLSPSVVKTLAQRPASELLSLGGEQLAGGLMPLFAELYEDIATRTRNLGEILGPEDVFELEHGTALAEFSQRVALRQTLQAAVRFESALPPQPIPALPRRFDVATHLLDEDAYPVGGFTSISTRGSIESLLHSQLAFMEQDDDEPDLFDLKFLRDELLYYSRDDNQFLRQRRSYLFALFPDLVETRIKDAVLPWQRIIVALACLLVSVRKLCEWLSTDALQFEVLFIEQGQASPLTDEQQLLEILLREQIANGTVRIRTIPWSELADYATEQARRSRCHCVTFSATDHVFQPESTLITRLILTDSTPGWGIGEESPEECTADEPSEIWQGTLERLLASLM